MSTSRTLVAPSRDHVWRAGLPYHVIALFGLLFAFALPSKYLGALWVALLAFLFGVGRSVSWLVGVGKYSVVDTDAGLGLARRGKVMQVVPWTEIEKVEWGGGSKFPSIDDPVSFPTFEIDTVDPNGDFVTQDILVIGAQARRGRQMLEE